MRIGVVTEVLAQVAANRASVYKRAVAHSGTDVSRPRHTPHTFAAALTRPVPISNTRRPSSKDGLLYIILYSRISNIPRSVGCTVPPVHRCDI